MEKDHFPDNYNKNNRARGSDSNRRLPIVFNLNIGHAMPRCIIPFGVEATVDAGKQVIRFAE